jgi:hypothetical protein
MPAEPSRRGAKRFRDLRSSVAYMVFLWLQFPGHRVDLARFLRRALVKRVPGSGAPAAAAAGLSLFQIATAVVGGIRIYRKARHEWLSHTRVAGGTVDTATPRVVTLR